MHLLQVPSRPYVIGIAVLCVLGYKFLTRSRGKKEEVGGDGYNTAAPRGSMGSSDRGRGRYGNSMLNNSKLGRTDRLDKKTLRGFESMQNMESRIEELGQKTAQLGGMMGQVAQQKSLSR